MEPNPAWLSLLADLFTNLAAGWLAAAFYAGTRFPRPLRWKMVVTTDAILVIVSLLVAFKLKQISGL